MRRITSPTTIMMSTRFKEENSGRRRTGALQSHNQGETAQPYVDRVSMNERDRHTQ